MVPPVRQSAEANASARTANTEDSEDEDENEDVPIRSLSSFRSTLTILKNHGRDDGDVSGRNEARSFSSCSSEKKSDRPEGTIDKGRNESASCNSELLESFSSSSYATAKFNTPFATSSFSGICGDGVGSNTWKESSPEVRGDESGKNGRPTLVLSDISTAGKREEGQLKDPATTRSRKQRQKEHLQQDITKRKKHDSSQENFFVRGNVKCCSSFSRDERVGEEKQVTGREGAEENSAYLRSSPLPRTARIDRQLMRSLSSQSSFGGATSSSLASFTTVPWAEEEDDNSDNVPNYSVGVYKSQPIEGDKEEKKQKEWGHACSLAGSTLPGLEEADDGEVHLSSRLITSDAIARTDSKEGRISRELQVNATAPATAVKPMTEATEADATTSAFFNNTQHLAYSWDVLRLGTENGSAALNEYLCSKNSVCVRADDDANSKDVISPQESILIVNTLRGKTLLPPRGSDLHRVVQKSRFDNMNDLWCEKDKTDSDGNVDSIESAGERQTPLEDENGSSSFHCSSIPFETLGKLYEIMCSQDVDDGSFWNREARYLTSDACINKMRSLENAASELKLLETRTMERAAELGLSPIDTSRFLGNRKPDF